MKILFDAHLSENKMSGIGRYINELLKTLTRIDLNNEYFILVSSNLSPEHDLRKISLPNVHVLEVKYNGISLKQNWIVPELIKKIQPDLYHHPHFDLPFFINIPCIATIHDVIYFLDSKFFPKKAALKRFYMARMFAHTLKSATRVLTISETTKSDLIKLFSADDEKIDVIHHGIHKMTSPGEKDEIHILNNKGINRNYFLFVGIRRPHKNLPRLIEAYKKLPQGIKNRYQLVIAGKKYVGYDQPENLIKSHQLDKDVIIMDYVSDEHLDILFNNCFAFVFPSLYEGFGLPLLEAMVYGKPILASNIAAIPEVLGDAGILFDPKSSEDIMEKLVMLINDNSLKKDLCQKSLIRKSMFSWENAAHKTLESYKKAIS